MQSLGGCTRKGRNFRLKPVLTLPAILCLLAACPVAFAEMPQFSLPLDCEPGNTCFIQQYVDIDPSDQAIDYACGAATFNGHKGTDFRLLSTAVTQKNIEVRAAAAGVIKAMRDGMPDVLARSPAQRRALAGRECGNGVVIDHGDGWETQYCHLKRGSVQGTKGENVKRGAKLGFVGYSGQAAFAHVHIAVRHKGRIIDPFTGLSPENSCGSGTLGGLWTKDVVQEFPYRKGVLIEVGFSDRPVKTIDLERGSIASSGLDRRAPILIFYGRFINLVKGDRIHLEVNGPSGFSLSNESPALAKRKAHYVVYVGRKRRGNSWPAGSYQGSIQLIRDGKVLMTQSAELILEE